MSDGAEFEIDVEMKGGGDVESAAASLANFTSKLELAGTAATAASAAVKAGETAYSQAETAADRAGKALERIGIAADAQRGKLAAAMDTGDTSGADRAAAKLQALTQRQTEAAAKADATRSAMNAAAQSLDTLRGSAAAAADNEARLSAQTNAAAAAAKSAATAAKDAAAADAKLAAAAASAAKETAKTTEGTDKASKAAGGGALNFRALGAGLGKLGGPLGSIGSTAAGVGGAVQKLSKALGSTGPYVAAAVLAVALAAAFVVAGLAITKFAVSAADTARTQALLSDGIAGSVQGGRELDASLERLSNTVPIARDELTSMASELAKSGLKGQALTDALETAAVKAAKLKFGPDFAKQMLSLPNQAERLKSNFTGLFSGLKIEALLEGLSKLVKLFDSNEESGKAIKVVFESMFQPVVDGLTAIIPKAVSTFLQLEILAMKGLIAIHPYNPILRDIAIGFAGLAILVAGLIAILVAVGVAPIAAFALILALPFIMADAFNYLGSAIKSGVGAAMDWLTEKFNAAVAFLEGLSLSEIGVQLIAGLVAGITGAGGSVLSAITGIASGAVDAAKKALGIASPSKVFAEIGMHTAHGMSQGVDDAAGGVQGSMEAMVAPPAQAGGAPAAAGGAAPAASSSGGGPTFYITVTGGGDAQSIAEAVKEAIAEMLAQAGGALPSAS